MLFPTTDFFLFSTWLSMNNSFVTRFFELLFCIIILKPHKTRTWNRTKIEPRRTEHELEPKKIKRIEPKRTRLKTSLKEGWKTSVSRSNHRFVKPLTKLLYEWFQQYGCRFRVILGWWIRMWWYFQVQPMLGQFKCDEQSIGILIASSMFYKLFWIKYIKVFHPVLSQPAIFFKILLLILLFVATKMSSSPPVMHIGDFS